MEFWECKKYRTTMLLEKSRAFCARGHEASLNDKAIDFEFCIDCERGILMYDLGHHKNEPVIIDHEKEIAAMERVCHLFCEKHGEYTSGGPRAKCPQCKIGEGKPGLALAKPKTSKKIPLRQEPVVNLSSGINFDKYPKLKTRLIS